MAAAHSLWGVQMRENRTPDRKRRTASCVALTAMVVLVAASLVGSAQAAYSCTSDSQCQYPTCNDRPCSSSSNYCINGKWKAECSSSPYSSCVSGTQPRKSAYTTLAPMWDLAATGPRAGHARACVACVDLFWCARVRGVRRLVLTLLMLLGVVCLLAGLLETFLRHR